MAHQPREPYFDSARNAWILTRYRDVAAALKTPLLTPATARSAIASPVDSAAHSAFRSDSLRVLAASLRDWEAQFAELAGEMAETLPSGEPIELMERYVKPWSLAVAGIAAGAPHSERERLSSLAGQIFDAACEPFDPALDTAAREATTALARFFQSAPAIHMQMFVALAHSLPAFLGLACRALLEHPAELARLREQPSLLPQAIDELLRYAGPARAQFRQAAVAVGIADCHIQPGQRVILMLDAANRDPQQFAMPDKLRLDRRDGAHLAFGGGPHACVGAMLVQTAAAAALEALLSRFEFPEKFSAVPAGCFGMRFLKSLTLVFYRLGSSPALPVN